MMGDVPGHVVMVLVDVAVEDRDVLEWHQHVDRLLAQGSEQMNLETTRLSAEIMFIKTRLLIDLNQVEVIGVGNRRIGLDNQLLAAQAAAVACVGFHVFLSDQP